MPCIRSLVFKPAWPSQASHWVDPPFFKRPIRWISAFLGLMHRSISGILTAPAGRKGKAVCVRIGSMGQKCRRRPEVLGPERGINHQRRARSPSILLPLGGRAVSLSRSPSFLTRGACVTLFDSVLAEPRPRPMATVRCRPTVAYRRLALNGLLTTGCGVTCRPPTERAASSESLRNRSDGQRQEHATTK